MECRRTHYKVGDLFIRFNGSADLREQVSCGFYRPNGIDMNETGMRGRLNAKKCGTG